MNTEEPPILPMKTSQVHADVDSVATRSDSTQPISTAQVDDEYNFYRRTEDADLQAVEAKNVLRKIDRRVVPLLFFIYLFQYLDKTAINYASAFGLEKGLNLKGQDFSWLGSLFYFGYLWAQFPAGYLLQRLRVGKFIAITTIIWGIILMTTPACTNFTGIAINRFLLGTFESVVNPGFVLIMSIWYTAQEQPLRLESYYCTQGLSNMFGGLVGYAIGHITTGLPQWMYVFIIFGSLSLLCGILAVIFLPDAPSTAKFLSTEERLVATHRVASNRQGIKNSTFKWYQIQQAMTDPKTYILFVMTIGGAIPNAATTQFTSLVIKSFQFDTLGSQYLQIPGGAIQFTALVVGGWICSTYPNMRCITMITGNTICIIGAGLLVGLPTTNKWGRLVGLWLCYFQSLGFSLSITMVSSNVAGTTKKQFTAAVFFTAFCIGNIVGPQTFKSSEAPHYHSAYVTMMIGYIMKLISVFVLYAYMYTVNKRRDREGWGTGDDAKQAVERGMQDMTEFDNKGFRYTL